MKWKWPLQRREFELGDTTVALDVVADPDAVLDAAVEAERDGEPATLPYWASVWPSGIALARWALANVRPGQSVLDLGCGMGLVGAAAAKAGGVVTVADIEPDAVELAAHNTGGRGLVMDFTDPPTDETFDWILGGDVLYEREIAEALAKFIERHGGRAVLADPHRQSAEAFLAVCACDVQPVSDNVRLIHIDM
ncbi:MAG: methyltransferase domain-containing protein [Planctomycetota bacterium]